LINNQQLFRFLKNGLKNTSKDVIPNAAWRQVGDKVYWYGQVDPNDRWMIEKHPRTGG
jgi:hypothetical protein